MRPTDQINDPSWEDLYDRDALISELEEKLRDEVRVLSAALHKGVQVQEDGKFYLVWTQEELDIARKKADELMRMFDE